jgi:hypothetical protein
VGAFADRVLSIPLQGQTPLGLVRAACDAWRPRNDVTEKRRKFIGELITSTKKEKGKVTHKSSIFLKNWFLNFRYTGRRVLRYWSFHLTAGGSSVRTASV